MGSKYHSDNSLPGWQRGGRAWVKNRSEMADEETKARVRAEREAERDARSATESHARVREGLTKHRVRQDQATRVQAPTPSPWEPRSYSQRLAARTPNQVSEDALKREAKARHPSSRTDR